MGHLLDLIAKIRELPPQQIAEDSLNAISEDIVQSQRDQLSKGQDSEGGLIRWQHDSHYPYTKPYERRKAKLGKQTKVVDLNLTGKRSRRIEAKAEGGKVIIKSTDEKEQYLENNYGKDLINGLNQEHKGPLIREKLIPATGITLRKYIKV
jgi:hypothetical protein